MAHSTQVISRSRCLREHDSVAVPHDLPFRKIGVPFPHVRGLQQHSNKELHGTMV